MGDEQEENVMDGITKMKYYKFRLNRYELQRK